MLTNVTANLVKIIIPCVIDAFLCGVNYFLLWSEIKMNNEYLTNFFFNLWSCYHLVSTSVTPCLTTCCQGLPTKVFKQKVICSSLESLFCCEDREFNFCPVLHTKEKNKKFLNTVVYISPQRTIIKLSRYKCAHVHTWCGKTFFFNLGHLQVNYHATKVINIPKI